MSVEETWEKALIVNKDNMLKNVVLQISKTSHKRYSGGTLDKTYGTGVPKGECGHVRKSENHGKS